MASNNQSGQDRSDNGTTMADRASDLKERAGTLFQGGVDAVKNHPGTAAAVVGGVAAAAAAVMNKDRIVEAAGAMREKMNSNRSDKTPDNA
jgi:hypothetical protein